MPGPTQIGPRQPDTTEIRKPERLIKGLSRLGLISKKAEKRSRVYMTRRDQAHALHATQIKVFQGLGVFAKKRAREKAARRNPR